MYQINMNISHTWKDVVSLRLGCWTLDQKFQVKVQVGSLCCVLGQDTTLFYNSTPPQGV